MKILPLIFALTILAFTAHSYPSRASELNQKSLSPNDIAITVDQISKVLRKSYVYPEVAAEMQKFIYQQKSSGQYGDASTLSELITKIQSDLRGVSGDGHISVLLAKDTAVRAKQIKPKSQKPIYADFVSKEATTKKIGYLSFNMFRGDLDTKNSLIKSMEKLSTGDSLIIDLRENIGGDPRLVAFLSSYFLESDTHLWSVYDRGGNEVIEIRSSASPHKFSGKLCILISNKTYSAAEAFTYTLKHLGRACIVGETTGGGAHLVEMMRVNDEINLWTPVARAYNSVTESNWEGTGVIPTIEVEASEAKSVAIDFLSNEY